MHNQHRFHWPKVALILICGSLLTACANNPFSTKKTNTAKKMSVPSSACIGNAYLQKYGCSISRIQQAAQSGDPDAQYALGYMYYYGIGTVRDRQTAKLWIGRAAKQGQPIAKKAEQLMSGGQGLHSLHHGSASGQSDGDYANRNSNTGRQATQYTPTADVNTLNNSTPDKPLNDVLPNYKKQGQSKAVIKSLQDKSKATTPTDSSPTNTTPAVEPITRRYGDPRLAPGSSPVITVTAEARGAITAAERSMMSVPKRHFTLQLMGGHNLAAIKAFMHKNNLEGTAQYYSAQLNHESWYMLVYGNYASSAQAHMAARELPPALRRLHPWAKSYRIVHDEIRLRRIIS